MKTQKRKIQSKLKNRKQVSASVERAIRKAVEQTAQRFHCSMAMVQNVALAEFFGIDPFEDFRGEKSKARQVGANKSNSLNRRQVSVVH